MGSQVAFSLLKTLLGAWITNRRTQSSARKCIFCANYNGDLQHLINCNVLWLQVSYALLPFLPYVDTPLSLLGLAPISCFQILGAQYAFMAYHSLRVHTVVTKTELQQCLKSIISSTSIHKHVLKAHLGQCKLKDSLRADLNPTQTTSTNSHSCTTDSGCSSALHESFPINLRLRMPIARRNKLRAHGFDIGSGPVYHRTTTFRSTCPRDPRGVQFGAAV